MKPRDFRFAVSTTSSASWLIHHVSTDSYFSFNTESKNTYYVRFVGSKNPLHQYSFRVVDEELNPNDMSTFLWEIEKIYVAMLDTLPVDDVSIKITAGFEEPYAFHMKAKKIGMGINLDLIFIGRIQNFAISMTDDNDRFVENFTYQEKVETFNRSLQKAIEVFQWLS